MDALSKHQPAFPPGPSLAELERFMAEHPGVHRHVSLASRLLEGAEPHRPLVSIVTVVHNGASTLPRCLESVASQDYHPMEHIVVDGGSGDGTVEIIRSRADSLTAWLSEPDAGISDAFNKGIGLCQGDILGLLNADDWYEPGAVREAVGALVRHAQAGAVCGRLRLHREGSPEVEFPSQPERLWADMTVNHPTLFVRRWVYQRIGLYRTDLALAMDYDWVLRARRSAVIFLNLDRVLANMAWEGASDRHWPRTLLEVARVIHGHYPRSPLWHGRLLIKLAKATTARLMEAAGLGGLARFYRAHLSPFRRLYTRG